MDDADLNAAMNNQVPLEPKYVRLSWARRSLLRFRRAVILGLAVVLPPVLTVVILLWVIATVRQYVLTPVEDGVREYLVWQTADIYREPRGKETRQPVIQHDGKSYHRLAGRENVPGEYIPSDVYRWLEKNRPFAIFPATGTAAYRQYIRSRYMQPSIVVPVFVCFFMLFLYFLGKVLAVGTWDVFEKTILRLPLVRWVYATVKRITDFVFVESKHTYKRVVAVEYPRTGIWSLGLVTSDGVPEVNSAAKEPTVT